MKTFGPAGFVFLLFSPSNRVQDAKKATASPAVRSTFTVFRFVIVSNLVRQKRNTGHFLQIKPDSVIR